MRLVATRNDAMGMMFTWNSVHEIDQGATAIIEATIAFAIAASKNIGCA
jgi:hypothetical protein